ncbi:MAG: hypothetical protein HC848_10990 [Limnobacter sp.]|nr:hypothetical protein [Limnobacter sp.]
MPLIPGLCVLSALGLSTMRRSLVGLIDWFALLCFSAGAVLVWVGWSAATFGWPAKVAQNFEKLSPGYQASMPGVEFALAVLASMAWVVLVVWRTRRAGGSGSIWRPMVLTSGGVTLIWLLLMTLWVPRLDYAKSFKQVAIQMQTAMQPTGKAGLVINPGETCIVDYGLGYPQRALMQYHSGLAFKTGLKAGKRCNYLLLQDDKRSDFAALKAFQAEHAGQWETLWTGNRNSDRHERLVLLRRIPQAQAQ